MRLDRKVNTGAFGAQNQFDFSYVKQGDGNVNNTLYGQNNNNDNDNGFQNTKPNSMNPNNQNVGNVAANQDEARERYNAML